MIRNEQDQHEAFEAFEMARRQLIAAIDADERKQKASFIRKRICKRFGNGAASDK